MDGMNWKTVRHCSTYLLIGALGLPLIGAQDSPPASLSPWVNTGGDISLPTDIRADWVHLGSWSLVDGMHDVYLYPKSALASYRETGAFAPGTVLVKEVRGAHTGTKTTGEAQWAGDIIQWFVMVKDGEDRFPDNPIWGDGWGWALFKPDDPTKQLATSYLTDCMGCHIPAAKTDRVYVEGYPTLASFR